MTTTNQYPFPTKKSILASQSNPETVLAHLVILYQAQTAHEQDTKTTKIKNRRGFMSSHAVHGTRIAQAFLSGEALSDEDFGRAQGIVKRYSKQLAAHFRAEMIEANPDLQAVADQFSAG